MNVDEALDKISEEHGVTILKARDYGSRAWNLHNEDSDKDIAIVFKQPLYCYAGLSTYTDTIDRSFNDGDIEIIGWNVKNFFHKLKDSNPSAIEFLSSGIEYYSHPEYYGWDNIEEYMMNNFSPVSLFHHYRKMGKEQYERYLADNKKSNVKKNLYVLRALLYAKWIEEKHTFPTLDFEAFLDRASEMDCFEEERERGIFDITYDLVEMKRENNNIWVGNPAEDYIKDRIKVIPDPHEHKPHEPEPDELNKLLRRYFR